MGKFFFSPMLLAVIGLMFIVIAGSNAAENEAQSVKVYEMGADEVTAISEPKEDTNDTKEVM